MKRKLFDWFLLVVVLSGGALAWQTGRERSRLTERHGRLASMTGDLPIADASKVYVRALDSGDPLNFAWCVYFPPNCRQLLIYRFGGGQYTCWPCPSADSIARVRFRRDDQGVMQVYIQFGGISTRIDLGGKELAELMQDRWDKVRIEQLGAPELTVMKPDQRAVLLRFTLPDDLQAEARKKLSSYNQKRFVPVLFELELTLPPVRP